jgi:hypothetical protein
MERARPFGGECAPLGEGAPLWGRAHPSGRGHVHFDLVGEKGRATFADGAPLLQRARPFGKGLFQSVTMNFNLLISIQYPDGIVQVVSTKGVAVSIAGCRLTTGPPRFSFIGNPPGRPVQNAPFLR